MASFSANTVCRHTPRLLSAGHASSSPRCIAAAPVQSRRKVVLPYAAAGPGGHLNPTSRSTVKICNCLTVGASVLLGTLATADPTIAADLLRQEPANALSIPTWAIHVSSVTEWVVAMGLIWRYAEVSGNPKWKGLTWGMIPSLGGAMAACTYHFFYNSPDLDFLVALQALLTVVGNTTCGVAAYRIYADAQQQRDGGSA